MTDSSPELVQQVLRQADIDAGDEHICAQGLEFTDSRPQPILVLLIRHRFAV